jgi:hypothetical protein
MGQSQCCSQGVGFSPEWVLSSLRHSYIQIEIQNVKSFEPGQNVPAETGFVRGGQIKAGEGMSERMTGIIVQLLLP